MRKIIETLLEEGIDESMIHRVLDLIEEEYEVIESLVDSTEKKAKDARNNVERYTKAVMSNVGKIKELGNTDKSIDTGFKMTSKAQHAENLHDKAKKLSSQQKLPPMTKNEKGEIKQKIRRDKGLTSLEQSPYDVD